MSKAEIEHAIGQGRGDQLYSGYPKEHGNYEKLFNYDTGKKSGLEEYPIIPGSVVWDGCKYFSHVGLIISERSLMV